jgi:hypothetical protein
MALLVSKKSHATQRSFCERWAVRSRAEAALITRQAGGNRRSFHAAENDADARRVRRRSNWLMLESSLYLGKDLLPLFPC